MLWSNFRAEAQFASSVAKPTLPSPLHDSFAQGLMLSRLSLLPILITALGVSKLTPKKGGELCSMETSSQLSQFSQIQTSTEAYWIIKSKCHSQASPAKEESQAACSLFALLWESRGCRMDGSPREKMGESIGIPCPRDMQDRFLLI